MSGNAAISRESALALIEDANRWQRAYNGERDRVALLRQALQDALAWIPPEAASDYDRWEALLRD